MAIRKRGNKRITASKRAQLEDKLDDLVSLLRNQQAVPTHPRTPDLQTVTPCSLDYSPQVGTDTPCDDSLTDQELQKFQDYHMSYFPFFFLPPGMTAEQLRKEKPLLTSAIQVVCNKAFAEQSELSKTLRSTIALQLMVDGERNVDLLLSLIACVTWSIYFTAGKRFLVMFSSAMRSLVVDLQMDRPKNPSWCPSQLSPVAEVITQSNEGRRALLASYALTAMVSMTFKSDTIPWSSQMEEDCAKLASDMETEGDTFLVAMVQISKLLFQASEIYRHLFENATSAAILHIEPLKSSLDEVKAKLSVKQKLHVTVKAYLYAAEVSIYELAILQPIASVTSSSSNFDHRRISYLMSCVQTCKACSEYYLESELIRMTMASGLIFSYSMKILHKLSTVQDPQWNTSFVRDMVYAETLIENCAVMAEQSNVQLKAECGQDTVFKYAAKLLRDMAPKWHIMGGQDAEIGRDPAALVALASESWSGMEAMDLPLVDFSDDFWLNAPFNL
ncbi:hypothetical protein DE146DRAFT_67273 [Phaeosphaeria sp. MPI-PUGE-AT-0046c]|nr:hypothetical protein DE146DRAFT_67273 [Phaeosphaeria sp. MPI-PUGE-AT-0046c]